MGSNPTTVKDIFSLAKVMVSASITFTTFTGYVTTSGRMDVLLLPALMGVLLMAAGASAFNHFMERESDKVMPRTANRPLPSGRFSPLGVIFVGCLWLVIGGILLYVYVGWLVVALGLFNAVWYNLVYTPLKRVSVYALFAGTITGVVPLFMGIAAANGNLFHHQAVFVGFFMLIWQVPHFLILLVKYGKEYEMAGLASVTSKFKPRRVILIAYLWIIASCVATLYLPLFGLLHHSITGYVILAIVITVVTLVSLNVFTKSKTDQFKVPFILTNIMQAGFMLCLVVDSLV